MFKIDVAFSREILIQKNFDHVKDLLSDFSRWNIWSPWICLEPNAKTEMSGVSNSIGQKISWSGEIIGTGEMTLAKITNNRIDVDLQFFKPFKSTSKAWFVLVEEANATKVIWGMKSSLPFFLFFLRTPMIAYVGNDFERGLLRLKDLCEKDAVVSKMSEIENVNQSPVFYIGINSKCATVDLKKVMSANFDKITNEINSGKIPVPNGFMSITHKFDLVNLNCDISCTVFYHAHPGNILNYEVKEMKPHKALKLTHQGPYEHLGSAWSKVICYQRGKKISINKKVPMYEIYLNSPTMVETKDILTDVYLPIK